jgi:ribonuclease J
MSHGFVGPDEEPTIIEGVQRVVMDALGGESQHTDWTGIRETLKDDVATYLHQQTRRRPLVLPVTVEV